ncbi:MAG: hypothetical protein AABW50_05890 [Nanoarchaeota archaeon]
MKKSLVYLVTSFISLLPNSLDSGMFDLVENRFIRERLDKVQEKGVSNCVGTARYLLGLQEEDKYSDDLSLREAGYNNVAKPSLNDLVIWFQENEYFFWSDYHVGIITKETPLSATFR